MPIINTFEVVVNEKTISDYLQKIPHLNGKNKGSASESESPLAKLAKEVS